MQIIVKQSDATKAWLCCASSLKVLLLLLFAELAAPDCMRLHASAAPSFHETIIPYPAMLNGAASLNKGWLNMIAGTCAENTHEQ